MQSPVRIMQTLRSEVKKAPAFTGISDFRDGNVYRDIDKEKPSTRVFNRCLLSHEVYIARIICWYRPKLYSR